MSVRQKVHAHLSFVRSMRPSSTFCEQRATEHKHHHHAARVGVLLPLRLGRIPHPSAHPWVTRVKEGVF